MLKDWEVETLKKDLNRINLYKDMMATGGWEDYQKYVILQLHKFAKLAGNTKQARDNRLVALGVLDALKEILCFPNKLIGKSIEIESLLAGENQ